MDKTSYYAGLFDGEGTVGIYQVKGWNKNTGHKIYWGIKLSITGRHLPMINSIRDHFGYGGIYKSKRIKKSYEPGFRDQCWQWQISNRKDIKDFLTKIRPLLQEKAEQVDIAIKFIDGELAGSKASDMCKKSKQFEFKSKDNKETFVEANFKGSNNPIAKLDEDKVRQIKIRILGGERQIDLAKEFNVERGAISKIIKGKTWTHVKVDMTDLPEQKGGFKKLNENDVRSILLRKTNGEKQSILAKEFKISQTAISEIVNRKKWLHVNLN
jgi:Mor family transcriptional regulator